MDRYIYRDGKKMRYGYTTGSCATAAAKGAALMLIHQKEISKVHIDTPKGWELELDLEDIEIQKNQAKCSVIKDAGDDPDNTDGIKIFATVERVPQRGIIITGGKGVGKVTKRGLPVKVGEYAINPVPLRTIREAVQSVLPSHWGVKVTIWVPQGEEIAKKTFNPHLGIQGGISILGTSGIVEPMSEEAFKASLALEISVKKEEGYKKIMLSPGNYGRDFAKALGLDTRYLLKTSNFIGFMLDKAEEYAIEEILWVGHIGKMVKVAAGNFHTHSKVSDARMETLGAYVGMLGGSTKMIREIMHSNTTEAVLENLENWPPKDELYYLLAQRVSDRCERRIKNSIKIGTLLFSNKQGLLGQCKNAPAMVRRFKIENH